ncbi:MAG: preprotein translocase subunit SecE [Pseudomonadales bacterium]|nr:preprotein translocase subunit SecE [Pseudomonadales bacterium]
MSAGTEAQKSTALDWLKWLVVAACAGAGVVGNWYFQDHSLLLRVIGLIVVGSLGLYIASLTESGGAAWELIREARVEIRRVVWPSNQETTQTTLVVLVLIAIFALLLWLLDWTLSALVTAVIG